MLEMVRYHVLLSYPSKYMFLYFPLKNKMMFQATFLGGQSMREELPGLPSGEFGGGEQ